MHMKWEDKGIKTPLARARGLGASHDGTGRWITLRVTAVANIFLVAWFIWFVKASAGMPHSTFTAFLAQPVNALAMILFIVSVFWHACLGSREIVEDYVHHEGCKLFKLIGQTFFFFAGGAAGIFCVLKIALAGG